MENYFLKMCPQNIEFPYETACSCESSLYEYNICILIPQSKKYIGYITNYENTTDMYFVLYELNRYKKICNVVQIASVFHPYLEIIGWLNKTVLYGSVINNVFIIEDILSTPNFTNTRNILFKTKVEKIIEIISVNICFNFLPKNLENINNIFTSDCLFTCKNIQNDTKCNNINIINKFALPYFIKMNINNDITKNIQFIINNKDVEYSVHHLQFRNLNILKPIINIEVLKNGLVDFNNLHKKTIKHTNPPNPQNPPNPPNPPNPQNLQNTPNPPNPQNLQNTPNPQNPPNNSLQYINYSIPAQPIQNKDFLKINTLKNDYNSNFPLHNSNLTTHFIKKTKYGLNKYCNSYMNSSTNSPMNSPMNSPKNTPMTSPIKPNNTQNIYFTNKYQNNSIILNNNITFSKNINLSTNNSISENRNLSTNQIQRYFNKSYFNMGLCNYSKPQYKKKTTFEVVADYAYDIYKLYAYDNVYINSLKTNNEITCDIKIQSRIYFDIAYIPDYNTSKFMNSIFRKIKENDNLDLIEESDDEEEFENINIDKYVDVFKKVNIECIFNYKFKKWVPVTVVKNNVNYGKIVPITNL
jgi:hypothetical protein